MPPEPQPPFPVEPVPPELLAWAKQPEQMAEFMADFEETLRTGSGCTLESFIDELKAIALGTRTGPDSEPADACHVCGPRNTADGS